MTAALLRQSRLPSSIQHMVLKQGRGCRSYDCRSSYRKACYMDKVEFVYMGCSNAGNQGAVVRIIMISQRPLLNTVNKHACPSCHLSVVPVTIQRAVPLLAFQDAVINSWLAIETAADP